MNTQTSKNLMIPAYQDSVIIVSNQFLIDKKSQGKSPGTIHYYEFAINKFLKYCDAQSVTTVDQITPNFIQEFYTALREEGKGNGGILGFHRAIRSLLNWHWWYNDIRDIPNPIKKVKPPKKPNEIIDPVTDEQIEAMLRTCHKDTFADQRDSLIITILACTGLRASELCNIQLSDIDLGNNQIFIRHGKGDKPRTVFFGRDEKIRINRFIRNYGKSEKWLFTNQMGEKLVYVALRQIIRRRSQYAGVTGVECHDFRRYFTLKSINNGMDLLTLSRILGHKDISLLTIYAKQSTEDLQLKYKQAWGKCQLPIFHTREKWTHSGMLKDKLAGRYAL